MNLEELIYKRFSESEKLAKYLAVFAGKPAIFSLEAPASNQDGWGETQYPRATYNFDLQANEERKSAGTLAVTLLCQNTAEIVPEKIEPEIRACLRDVLLHPDGGVLYAFTWARTDAFSIQESKQELIIGSEIRFDILECTCQETTDPDPIAAANQYLKELYSKCVIIGQDRIEEITEATAKRPVVYCRFTSIEKTRETNTVVWMDGKIAIHILCPDSEKRTKLTADIANTISLDGEIIMLDKSPMFIKGIEVNYKADYLTSGQIYMDVRYGILRPHYTERKHILTGGKLLTGY